ncbi:hypothetical protein G443_000490 [Actinoalloteichus cyanogriseus DSM 43889]|uniref:Uncharacterized protein n=1 Tax=Actinoalloteichus caeruleus DSM 43889 TaxID=1120930 RepID=A0ABT1JCK8_ACTCY|nr:hypothetical protein [Actinoalloteichus caeruleus DSM 43889]
MGLNVVVFPGVSGGSTGSDVPVTVRPVGRAPSRVCGRSAGPERRLVATAPPGVALTAGQWAMPVPYPGWGRWGAWSAGGGHRGAWVRGGGPPATSGSGPCVAPPADEANSGPAPTVRSGRSVGGAGGASPSRRSLPSGPHRLADQGRAPRRSPRPPGGAAPCHTTPATEHRRSVNGRSSRVNIHGLFSAGCNGDFPLSDAHSIPHSYRGSASETAAAGKPVPPAGVLAPPAPTDTHPEDVITHPMPRCAAPGSTASRAHSTPLSGTGARPPSRRRGRLVPGTPWNAGRTARRGVGMGWRHGGGVLSTPGS